MSTTSQRSNGQWVQPNLVIAPLAARDAFDAITQLGERMYAAGCVKDSFVSAVIAREKTYATGLPTEGIQVAIPHTDVEHVLRDAIAVGVLREPVQFGEMGSPGRMLNVRLVCLLAASRADAVVLLLQKLAEMFQQQAVLEQIVGAKDAAMVAAIMNQHLTIEADSVVA